MAARNSVPVADSKSPARDWDMKTSPATPPSRASRFVEMKVRVKRNTSITPAGSVARTVEEGRDPGSPRPAVSSSPHRRPARSERPGAEVQVRFNGPSFAPPGRRQITACGGINDRCFRWRWQGPCEGNCESHQRRPHARGCFTSDRRENHDDRLRRDSHATECSFFPRRPRFFTSQFFRQSRRALESVKFAQHR
jgi:hypothetical protein